MQVHHGQAVEMAMQIYRTTEDTELRTLAYDIATGSPRSAARCSTGSCSGVCRRRARPLMSWMADPTAAHGDQAGTSGEPLDDAEAARRDGNGTDAELAELRAATGGEADCLFLELMIRHHEGAIPMAEAVLELGSEPRVLDVATSIKNGQTAEIDAMKSMQARLGCSG